MMTPEQRTIWLSKIKPGMIVGIDRPKHPCITRVLSVSPMGPFVVACDFEEEIMFHSTGEWVEHGQLETLVPLDKAFLQKIKRQQNLNLIKKFRHTESLSDEQLKNIVSILKCAPPTVERNPLHGVQEMLANQKPLDDEAQSILRANLQDMYE